LKIEFGVLAPQGWRLDLKQFKTSKEKYVAMVNYAMRAEGLNYDSVWLYDHFHTVPVPINDATFEAWTSLVALAKNTSTIRLGTLVSCNSYRNPAHLAKMAATVDCISNGRLEFGIGAGWYMNEYDAYGYEFPRIGERLSRLEESVQIIREMWMKDKASFKGSYYSIDGAVCNPKPMQKPYPRIWIGGQSNRALRIVSKYGDRWNFIGSAEDFAEKILLLRNYCEKTNRDFSRLKLSVHLQIVTGKNNKEITEAKKYIRKYIAPILSHPLDAFRFISRPSRRGAGYLAGSPEEISQKIERYVNAGASYFMLYFVDAPSANGMEAFAEKVISQFP
jgi:F420-dependent oxidoreductase-like protein